jgi:hypothetical protein
VCTHASRNRQVKVPRPGVHANDQRTAIRDLLWQNLAEAGEEELVGELIQERVAQREAVRRGDLDSNPRPQKQRRVS